MKTPPCTCVLSCALSSSIIQRDTKNSNIIILKEKSWNQVGNCDVWGGECVSLKCASLKW